MDTPMTENSTSDTQEKRRPRVAVLGEFSAGKSTFINLITGGKQLRTQVTATQMPAIWMSHGTDAPYAIDLAGNERPVDLTDLSSLSVSEIAYIRVFMETPILTLCDLIDTPGNSDPNIAPIAWERIAEIADIAVWCSPSTQAWRQSELAAWKDVPERVRKKSILLLTRADKLLTEEDRTKVLRRVEREAGDLFSKVYMASLLRFGDIHDPVRDLVDLCRELDTTEMPDSAETAEVLSGLFRGRDEETQDEETQSVEVESAQLAEDEHDDAFDIEEVLNMAASETHSDIATSNPQRDSQGSELGYATALWLKLTRDLPVDDPDALDAAFRRFLSDMDSEIAMLRDVADVKIAS